MEKQVRTSSPQYPVLSDLVLDAGENVKAKRKDETSPLECPTCSGTHQKRSVAQKCYADSNGGRTEKQKRRAARKERERGESSVGLYVYLQADSIDLASRKEDEEAAGSSATTLISKETSKKNTTGTFSLGWMPLYPPSDPIASM